MKKLEITFDYDNDGVCREHPGFSYSPREQTVYTIDGWKIWAKTEADAVHQIERELVRGWPEDYAKLYTKI